MPPKQMVEHDAGGQDMHLPEKKWPYRRRRGQTKTARRSCPASWVDVSTDKKMAD